MKTTLIAALVLTTAVFADDRIRDVQIQLKNQGFYYGEVDGVAGGETTASIRRFQIRNGLEVTGKLNKETADALGIGGASDPSPAKPATPAPPPAEEPAQLNPPAVNERKPAAQPATRPEPEYTPPKPPADFLRPPRGADDAPRIGEARTLDPDEPAYVDPPARFPSPVTDDYSTFYHGTPYENAPREVQIDVLRTAQVRLARRGLYRTVADGLPGPATAEALFAYQKERQLTRTGRLDRTTLASMGLLPGRSPDAPALRPFFDPNRRRDRSVDFSILGRF